MPENSVCKGEKTPWTRVRRWLCFLALILVMTTSLFIFYNSSLQVSWPLNLWTGSWSGQSYNNVTHSAGSGPPLQYFVAYPHQYEFIVDEPIRCLKESPFLVLMVPVTPHNREARDIIRNTWGKETTVLGQEVSHYFLLGLSKEEDGLEDLQEQVLQESQTHHDILQSDFLDSYNNLTIKTMVMFEWLSTHCSNTSYAMKIDSDMFLNVQNLIDMLLKAPKHLYMTGMMARGAPVLRDHTSKWFLPYSAFPESTYPPYALGMGYVFSLDLPKKILEASPHVKAVYIEDVYVGLCMRHAGLTLTDPPHGGLFRTTEPYLKSGCYWTSVITTILQNSKQLSNVWEIYQTEEHSGC
ncbi:beta-1,3-galactosyltransferase 1-like [Acanthochromis polyacanthus]|uniref:beta-1,3-galactosyltransferase 1-like n=1 Tax=Acanthochromis polyacanthus TaxID=80966 RepID=UPI002234244F|nr:beta-1,3-galactosyltransferase 1-like [Acanthochromis polyacanthus]